ncbi:MAG: hypothetical protein HY725_19405 [Candidatus Rokubacteria bacterium]|nr:hypothetical protein [Candidatus Rokubacteria bacterium]
MREIEFEQVVRIWEAADRAAGGRDTRGILDAFKPPLTQRWFEDEMSAREVADLRFIGRTAGDQFAAITGGTYRVGDSKSGVGHQVAFRWDPAWRIISLRDPEHGARVIIDGNGRSLALWQAVQAGEIPRERKVGIVVGDLAQAIVFRAKAIAPLWR